MDFRKINAFKRRKEIYAKYGEKLFPVLTEIFETIEDQYGDISLYIVNMRLGGRIYGSRIYLKIKGVLPSCPCCHKPNIKYFDRTIKTEVLE